MNWSIRSATGPQEGLAPAIGTREEVKAALTAAKDLPEHWRVALLAELAALPATVHALKLDACSLTSGGKTNYHITLTTLY